jgi:hypothetical protein
VHHFSTFRISGALASVSVIGGSGQWCRRSEV